MKKLDLVVYIGRFQPCHIGHVSVINEAFAYSDNILILIGSAQTAPSIKNPFTYQQRKQMIKDTIKSFNDPNKTVTIVGIPDQTYNDNVWTANVGHVVDSLCKSLLKDKEQVRVGIIGHDKDHSTFYLNYFPQWEYIEAKAFPESGETISATKIRQLIFTNHIAFTQSVLPKPVYEYINEYSKTQEYNQLVAEWEYVNNYKKQWANAPFPPTFVTCDAVVVQSGHVLLIKRNGFPGKGLWAMPGGFIDVNERLADAVIRELREETRLKVPEKVLRGSIDASGVFDDPGRSTRGRTITHAYRFTLDSSQPLPEIRGSSDAKTAKWVPLSEFDNMEPVMYEDHYHIIKNMLVR